MAALFPAYFLPLLPFVELCERGEAVAATAFATRTKKLSFVVLLYLLHTTPLCSIAEWCGLRCFLRPSDAVVTLNLVYVEATNEASFFPIAYWRTAVDPQIASRK